MMLCLWSGPSRFICTFGSLLNLLLYLEMYVLGDDLSMS